jgi:eukaryotic-like serine/threonine-protein kinase
MLSSGAVINQRYAIESKIGEGGFAHVFLAKDILLNRAVAIKILNEEFEGNQEFLRLFQQEARSVAALDHPNILQIYDFGLIPNQANPTNAFLVMPYLSGGSFSKLLQAGRLSLDEIGYYLNQLCSAVDYAHRQNVAHRDIKPQNILLRGMDGRPVLADFGFAKLIADAGLADQTKRLMGTPQYMSPEQFLGKVGFASDQYAIGIVLYQMLTETLPFSGEDNEIIKQHLELPHAPLATHPAMRKINPEIVSRLDKVLEKALSKNPTQRYANCDALYQAYRVAVKAEPKTPAPIRVDPLNQDNDQTEVYLTPKPPPPKPVVMRMKRSPMLRIRTEPDQRVYYDFELKGDVLTLGREVSNHLHVPLSIISRHHATFHRVGAIAPGLSYRIIDNNSLNKLFFRDQAIKDKVLEDGDVIRIGVPGYGDYVVYFTYQAPIFAAE